MDAIALPNWKSSRFPCDVDVDFIGKCFDDVGCFGSVLHKSSNSTCISLTGPPPIVIKQVVKNSVDQTELNDLAKERGVLKAICSVDNEDSHLNIVRYLGFMDLSLDGSRIAFFFERVDGEAF